MWSSLLLLLTLNLGAAHAQDSHPYGPYDESLEEKCPSHTDPANGGAPRSYLPYNLEHCKFPEGREDAMEGLMEVRERLRALRRKTETAVEGEKKEEGQGKAEESSNPGTCLAVSRASLPFDSSFTCSFPLLILSLIHI